MEKTVRAADEDLKRTNANQQKLDGSSHASLKPLRVWPAVILVVLMWAMRIGCNFISERTMPVVMTQFMGPMCAAVLIALWWMFFSRATGREKIFGTIGLAVIVGVTSMLADKTVKGFGTMIFAVPWGATLFAIAAVIARSWNSGRTVFVLLAALVGFGFWDLVRTDEIWGDFKTVRSWRWEKTAEDRFLESLASQPTSESAAATEATPLEAPEWPAFRGDNRRGEIPGLILDADWESHPPKEIWRVKVGPGFSSFAVAGNRIFTQQQRGDDEAVVCYNAEDGSELWVQQDKSRFWEAIAGAGPRGTPTIAGDGLFAQGASGFLNRLDPLTGNRVCSEIYVMTRNENRRRGDFHRLRWL